MTERLGLLVVHGIGDQRPGSVGAPIASLLADGNTGAVCTTDLGWEVSTNSGPLLVAEANWSHISSPENLPEIRLGTDFFMSMLTDTASAYRSFFGLRGVLVPDRAAPLACLLTHIIAIAFYWSFFNERAAPYSLLAGVTLSFLLSLRSECLSRLHRWWAIPVRAAFALLLAPLLFSFLISIVLWLPITAVFSTAVFLPGLISWPLVWLVRKSSETMASGPARLWLHRLTWLALHRDSRLRREQ